MLPGSSGLVAIPASILSLKKCVLGVRDLTGSVWAGGRAILEFGPGRRKPFAIQGHRTYAENERDVGPAGKPTYLVNSPG